MSNFAWYSGPLLKVLTWEVTRAQLVMDDVDKSGKISEEIGVSIWSVLLDTFSLDSTIEVDSHRRTLT